MKKLILSLFLFCSVFAFSDGTIPIPQIIGLPAALASKVDKVTGKSLVADTSIVKLTGVQAGAQVNKLEGIQKNGVDLTVSGKKVNITVPTTAAEIGAQPAGTYATGTGTAYNSNNGDETLTSIKTKLGAATAVSDGYLRYQDFALLHTPTTVTASNGLSISGQNISLQNASLTQSGALTFNDYNKFDSKEPAITKNSGFNLPIGTTPGTVLEGRTFGTAANSTVDNKGGLGPIWGDMIPIIGSDGVLDIGKYLDFHNTSNDGIDYANRLTSNGSNSMLINGYSIYHTGNLTSSLTTNSISKWNGTNFANSLISDDGTYLKMRNNLFAYLDGVNTHLFSGTNSFLFRNNLDNSTIFSISNVGNVSIPAATVSTSPTTGALVVVGGVGANHVRANNFYGNGSNLTGVQLPITLTTNGTSGAATFSGNVLNVPNYSSTGTGGTYTCTPTNVTNLTSSSIGMALYTKTGSVYRVSISGLIDPTASGTCVIRLPMPTNISGGVVPMCYSSSNFTTPQGWSVSAGSNYIDLSINTDGADCQFYANIAYVY